MRESRTDESFASRRDPEHHDDAHKDASNKSLLEIYNYRMVSQITLETMHMIDLGVLKQVVESFL